MLLYYTGVFAIAVSKSIFDIRSYWSFLVKRFERIVVKYVFFIAIAIETCRRVVERAVCKSYTSGLAAYKLSLRQRMGNECVYRPTVLLCGKTGTLAFTGMGIIFKYYVTRVKIPASTRFRRDRAELRPRRTRNNRACTSKTWTRVNIHIL